MTWGCAPWREPPLRAANRRAQIPLLSPQFLGSYAGAREPTITPRATAAHESKSKAPRLWPGTTRSDMGLLSEVQARDDLTIPVEARHLEVVEKPPSLGDEA